MKIPASPPDDAADDPRSGDRGEGQPRGTSSSSSSMSQSAPSEESSAASADGSPSASSEGDRELAEANAEEIDKLSNTLAWLAELVTDRTDPPSEAAADDPTNTADRGFQ